MEVVYTWDMEKNCYVPGDTYPNTQQIRCRSGHDIQ